MKLAVQLLAISCASYWQLSSGAWREAIRPSQIQGAVRLEERYFDCLWSIARSFTKDDLEGADIFFLWCDGQTATWCPKR